MGGVHTSTGPALQQGLFAGWRGVAWRGEADATEKADCDMKAAADATERAYCDLKAAIEKLPTQTDSMTVKSPTT